MLMSDSQRREYLQGSFMRSEEAFSSVIIIQKPIIINFKSGKHLGWVLMSTNEFCNDFIFTFLWKLDSSLFEGEYLDLI